MKIGIIGATGKLGTILVDRLSEKNEDIVAIVRNKSKLTKDVPVVETDIFDLTTEDIKDFDVLVNAFNAPLDDPNQFITSTDHLIDILKGLDTHLVFAGGAGVLLLDETTLFVESPELPEEFRPIAEAEVEAFKNLEKENNVNWTYMAPPAFLDFDGPHTGNHSFSGNKLGVNAEGNSYISYQDYADAFVEKILNPENHSIVGVYL